MGRRIHDRASKSCLLMFRLSAIANMNPAWPPHSATHGATHWVPRTAASERPARSADWMSCSQAPLDWPTLDVADRQDNRCLAFGQCLDTEVRKHRSQPRRQEASSTDSLHNGARAAYSEASHPLVDWACVAYSKGVKNGAHCGRKATPATHLFRKHRAKCAPPGPRNSSLARPSSTRRRQ